MRVCNTHSDRFWQTTWTEAEERRRVWWAVYVLDRVISLGSRRRFSLPEPADVDFLPVDDKAWVNILPLSVIMSCLDLHSPC